MKKMSLILLLITFNLTAFSQAREEDESEYKTIYSIIISKAGKIQHVIPQGAMMSSKVNGKIIKGRWFFKAYPDVVVIVGGKGEILGEVELRKELPLRITPPQQQGGMSVGIGVGPISVSGIGGGMKNFDLKKYKVEIDERKETKEEKMRREYRAKQEKERLEKIAAKKAKKEAKLAAKKKKK